MASKNPAWDSRLHPARAACSKKYPSEQEAVSKPESLIVEFWKVNDSGVPTGSPLGSRSLNGSSFTPQVWEIRSVDFSADHIKFEPSAQYAFTLKVENKSTTPGYGLYELAGH